MILGEDPTHYDLLELAPDASAQDLRAAYQRVKSAYRKDSVALYSLISEEETEGLLAKIEEAYLVLSHPERRKDYDRSHGLINLADDVPIGRPQPKVISIDRVPPMEENPSEFDLLVPPSTDFTQGSARSVGSTAGQSMGSGGGGFFDGSDAPLPSSRHQPDSPDMRTRELYIEPHSFKRSDPTSSGLTLPSGGARRTDPPAIGIRHPADQFNEQAIVQDIQQEEEWRGPFLRKVREARNVSLEELAGYTKISRTYISAIEDENFPKLPAAVYLRGFITQIAKYLKLPPEKVSAAYLGRFQTAKAEAEKGKGR